MYLASEKPALRAFLWVLLGLLCTATLPASGAERLLELNGRLLPEASGLTQSLHAPDRLWFLNDSGNSATLIAVDLDSGDHREVKIDGAKNRDWEDLAAFTVDNEPWLAIADIGDNNAKRKRTRVYLLPEPATLSPESVPTHVELKLTYPDGPRDAESLAIDSTTGTLYVLSKRDPQPRLYRARLPALKMGLEVDLELEFLGKVTSIPVPTEAEIKAHRYGRFRAQPTSMALSPNFPFIALLTYRGAYMAPLGDDRDWLRALNEDLCPLEFVALKQGETIAIDTRGDVIVASEGNRAPVYRIKASCSDAP